MGGREPNTVDTGRMAGKSGWGLNKFRFLSNKLPSAIIIDSSKHME